MIRNTPTIDPDEFRQRVLATFNADERELLGELTNIFLAEKQQYVHNTLDMDKLTLFLGLDEQNRACDQHLIVTYLDPQFIISYRDMILTFEGFVSACSILRDPRARLMQRLNSKCKAVYIECYGQLQVHEYTVKHIASSYKQ